MNYKTSYHLSQYGFFISLLIFIVASQTSESSTLKGILIAIGIISVILNILQEIVFCRCPYCLESLSSRTKLPTYCPKCGKKLE